MTTAAPVSPVAGSARGPAIACRTASIGTAIMTCHDPSVSGSAATTIASSTARWTRAATVASPSRSATVPPVATGSVRTTFASAVRARSSPPRRDVLSATAGLGA